MFEEEHKQHEQQPLGKLEEKYEHDLQVQMARLQVAASGRRGGEKNKRIEMKRNKILEENVLFEDEEEDEDENEEDQFEMEELEEEEEEEHRYGPNGEVYASSSSGEEEVEDEKGRLVPKRQFIPRCKLHAYKEAEGVNIKTQKRKPMKFTKGTDPRHKDMLSFMVDDSIGCPQFLPINANDVKVTNFSIEAAIHQPNVPLSEHIRKENFYKFFQSFTQAIAADPALIKTEILGRLHHYDLLYGIQHEGKIKRGERDPTRFT